MTRLCFWMGCRIWKCARESSPFPEGAAVTGGREAIHHHITPLLFIYFFYSFLLKGHMMHQIVIT